MAKLQERSRMDFIERLFAVALVGGPVLAHRRSLRLTPRSWSPWCPRP